MFNKVIVNVNRDLKDYLTYELYFIITQPVGTTSLLPLPK